MNHLKQTILLLFTFILMSCVNSDLTASIESISQIAQLNHNQINNNESTGSELNKKEVQFSNDNIVLEDEQNIIIELQKRINVRRKIIEQRAISEMRKAWNLSEEYCLNSNFYDNYRFCMGLLEDQAVQCRKEQFHGKNIFVDLNEQLLYAVKDCRLVAYSMITTGKTSTPTPVGHYNIYQRRGAHRMQGQWFVHQAFYFYGDYALHDAGWRQGMFWLPSMRNWHGSHGCINLPKKTMEILWDEFDIGDAVHIYKGIPSEIMAEIKPKARSTRLIDPTK